MLSVTDELKLKSPILQLQNISQKLLIRKCRVSNATLDMCTEGGISFFNLLLPLKNRICAAHMCGFGECDYSEEVPNFSNCRIFHTNQIFCFNK